MEPTTMIAIANFAYGMLNKPSGKNPMDALVKMLKAISDKLNVINDKLDEISQQITEIPDKVEYKRAINNLNAVNDYIPVLYKNYNDTIKEHGEYRGQAIFIDNFENTVERYLLQLRNSISLIKNSPDDLSVNYLCNSIIIDYELMKIINTKPSYIQNQLEYYLSFLKTLLYDEANSLIHMAEKLKTEKDNLLVEKFGQIQHNTILIYRHPPSPDYYENHETAYKILSTKFINRNPNNEEAMLVKYLYNKGYLEDTNYYKKINGVNISEVSKLPRNITSHNCKQRIVGRLGTRSGPRVIETNCNTLPLQEKLKKDLDFIENELISKLITIDNTVETTKVIYNALKRISE